MVENTGRKFNVMATILAAVIIGACGYVFYSYASYIDESAVAYSPFIDAILGGMGNTMAADVGLVLGILVITMNLISYIPAENVFAKILQFATGKIFGVIVVLVILLTLLGNGALIYLKFSEAPDGLYKAITGNGYAEIIICLCSVFLLFVRKGRAKNTANQTSE